MSTYKLITLVVDTPFGTNRPNHTAEEFMQMVNDAIKSGATPVGGINVAVLHSESAFPQFVYTQAVLFYK